jgi:hypothetical protein
MGTVFELLPQAIVLGFDSFLAGIGIGAILHNTCSRALLVIMFGACDGLATILGELIPHRPPEPPSSILYFLAVVFVVAGVRRNRSYLLALPVLLSVDNFFGGGTVAGSLVFALSSAAMAAFGIALGDLGRRVVSRSKFVAVNL